MGDVKRPFDPDLGDEASHLQSPHPAAPPMHWGTFSVKLELSQAISLASTRLKAAGFEILQTPSVEQPVAIGRNRVAIAIVACAAVEGGVWVLVGATSTDSGRAETYRNLIREGISGFVMLDEG